MSIDAIVFNIVVLFIYFFVFLAALRFKRRRIAKKIVEDNEYFYKVQMMSSINEEASLVFMIYNELLRTRKALLTEEDPKKRELLK